MKIKQQQEFKPGITPIVDSKGPYKEFLMDFEILKMNQGQKYSNSESLERAYLLINGKIKVSFQDKEEILERENFYDHDPILVQVCNNVEIEIECLNEDTEIAIFKTENDKLDYCRIYTKDDIRIEIRGKGTMKETATRIVRTIIDHSINPDSNLMIGEDMHYPGKWAGFPSHYHPQPEIYFYKFYPSNGFGLLKLEDEGVLLEQNDTVLIRPNLDHPQVAAPGYGMYFIWTIRHLEGNPYLAPIFKDEHKWAEEPDAVIWPDKH